MAAGKNEFIVCRSQANQRGLTPDTRQRNIAGFFNLSSYYFWIAGMILSLHLFILPFAKL